jgi:hypothetical protein
MTTENKTYTHPSYPDYGCDEKGNVYNIKMNHKIASKPYKLANKKSNGEDKLQYRVTVRKGNKYVQICLPRFVYECANNCVLERKVRVYKKVANDGNLLTNLYIKSLPHTSRQVMDSMSTECKTKPQTLQEIDDEIAKLQAQRASMQQI